MDLSNEEYYQQYLRVLKHGTLDQLDALDEAAEGSEELIRLGSLACEEYADSQGYKPTKQEIKKATLKIRTMVRRLWNGQSIIPKRRSNDR